MTFKKGSLIAVVLFFVLVNLGFGIASFTDLEFNPYISPMLLIFGSFILFMEVGLKKFTDISNLDDLSAMQYITIVIGLFAFVNGVLTLPGVDIQIQFLNQLTGFLLILIGLFAGLEAVTNR